MESTFIEVQIRPEKKLFYSEASSFGIYAVIVEEADRWEKVEVNTFGNIAIKGNMPELELGKTYVAEVTPKKDKKYGMGYEVRRIYSKAITTREEQFKFLSTLLTENQIESIFTAYPDDNVVDLIKTDKFDYNLTKGIGSKTYQKIKDKIIANEKYQMAIVILTADYGIPYNAVKRLSDAYGSPDLLVQKIEKNPYILIEVDGFGFKRVDEMAMKMGIEKKDLNRITSCIKYVLEDQANNGHSWVKRTEVVNQAISLLDIRISDVEDVMNKDDQMDFVVEDDIVYLQKYFDYELGIRNNIERLLRRKSALTIDDLDVKIKNIEKNQGFDFTLEQRKAIELSINQNIVIVNGKAGTGKTSTIKGIVEILQSAESKADTIEVKLEDGEILQLSSEESDSPMEYATCALSGKASQRIQESTGLDSFTIHRLLGYHPLFGWTYNHNNRLPKDVIILDEASMVNSKLFFYLLRAIKDGAKLVITGDTAQLEPIGVGNVLVDLIQSGVVPTVELTIVHRQAQRSGILSCANMVREGERFISNTDFGHKRLGELKDLYMYSYEGKDKVFDAVIKISKKYSGDLLDFQVIVPMKSRGELSTKNLNEELQKIFNQDPSNIDAKYKIERNGQTFIEGDKVIMQGNNYNLGVFNGTIGMIKYVDSMLIKEGEVVGEIIIDFEGIGDIRFSKSEMVQVDLAYAITAHKSQGSQWKYVVFAIDYASYVLLNRQLTYTAMTRAREALFMPVELRALQHSIRTDNSSRRRTFLPKLLPNMI